MLQQAPTSGMTHAATADWAFQIIGPLVWLALVVWVVRKSRREGRIAKEALILIAATSMWWQEWYGDWGAYVLYNPHFKLIPWHSTTWTSPNKPWAVIPAYGWYYLLEFLVLFGLVGWLRRHRPTVSPTVAALAIGIPLFYAFDLAIEGGAAKAGMWSYASYVGPALTFGSRSFPLLYPILFFTAWCTFMGALLVDIDGEGRCRLDRWLRFGAPPRPVDLPPDVPASGGAVAVAVRPTATTATRQRSQLVRVGAWILAFNVSYWVFFMLPIDLIRQFALHSSALVP